MTGPEMLAYVLRTFKRTDKNTEAYEAITDAAQDMKRDLEFDGIKTEADTTDTISVLGDYEINIDSNVGLIIGNVILRDGNNSRELEKLNKDEFNRLYPNQDAADATRGTPVHWCLFGGQLQIGPVPNKTTYTYHMSFTADDGTEVTAATASVPFSAVKQPRRALKFKALEYLYDGVENETQARKYGQLYEREMALVMQKERRNSGAVRISRYN